jgi:hypothetical protein
LNLHNPMISKKIALAAVSLVLLVGCGRKSDGAEGVTTVDFHGYTEKPLSELGDRFYSGKRYVALHAADQSLMIGNVGKVVIHGDRIFVSEMALGPSGDHKLVVHDADGRAIAKIGNKGRGPGEYLQITDFDVDSRGRVHLLDQTFGVKKIFIFDADYKFIEEKKDLPFQMNLMKCTPDGGYLFVLSTWDESEYAGKRFVKTDADLTVENTAGEYNMEQIDNNVVLGGYGSLVATSDGYYCQRTPEEETYRLDDDGNIVGTWFMDLGSRAIPEENRGDLMPLLESDKINSYSWFGPFVAPWGEYIFGGMIDGGERKSFVYDTSAGINYTQSAKEASDFGAFLTISDGRLVTFFPYFDGETFPSDLPPELRAGVTKGNPLLCLYELK